MFWGQHLKQAAPYKLSEHTASSLLHVSNVALASDSAAGKTKVWAQADGHKVLITSLEAGKYEHASLDLYFRVEQEVQFYVEGKGEVFIAGYYEPETDNEFGDFDEEGSSEEEGNGPFKALEHKKGKKAAGSESSEEEKPHVKAQPAKGQQPGKPGQQQQPGKPGPVQGQQGGKPVPAQQGGKPGQQPAQQQGKPGQQQPGKPAPQQGKPEQKPQGKPAQAAKKPEVGSSEDDEDLDDEIDDGDMDLGDDDDEDDLGLEEDDDESEEETHLGKRKGSKESGEGDHVKKQQKGNAGIPNVKQELKGQQGGKPGQQQGGKPQHQGGQQGGKPQHQGGQQGGKGTPPSHQNKGGQQQHSGGKPGQQHSGGKPQHQGGPHQGGKKNKKQH